MQHWTSSGGDRHLATLWDGFGSIVSRTYRHPNDPSVRHTVVKTVSPRRSSHQSESFRRKMISYQVERFVYRYLQSTHASSPSATAGFATAEMFECGRDFLILQDLSLSFPCDFIESDPRHAASVITWLSAFHAFFWGRSLPIRSMTEQDDGNESRDGVWDQGSYWYLATRGTEFKQLNREWRAVGVKVDGLLNSIPGELKTLVHGDAKAENVVVTREGEGEGEVGVAMFDFQYVGYGSGMKDVVYFLMTSVSGMTRELESEMLELYWVHLQQGLKNREDLVDGRKGATPVWKKFTREVMMDHYELCMVDWLRFMKDIATANIKMDPSASQAVTPRMPQNSGSWTRNTHLAGCVMVIVGGAFGIEWALNEHTELLDGKVAKSNGTMFPSDSVLESNNFVNQYLNETYRFVGLSTGLTFLTAFSLHKSALFQRLMVRNPVGITLGSLMAAGAISNATLVTPTDYSYIKYVLFGAVAACKGTFLSSTLVIYPALLARAGLYTFGLVSSMAFIGATANSDHYIRTGGPLLGALTVASIGTTFKHILPPSMLKMPRMYTFYLYGVLVIYSAFILRDMENVVKNGRKVHTQELPRDTINEALRLYLALMNIIP
ncbi:hypothetical protein HDU98_002303 [Podochytrium sp. JEL0797]|nr:hypothetical protein HDU98_002303 [Podochytrium sp. JEL0797]